MDVVLKPEDTTDSIITSLPAFINNINENIDELIKVELIKEEAPSELMKLEEFDWGVDGIGHELQHEVNIKPDETSSEDPFESVNSNTPEPDVTSNQQVEVQIKSERYDQWQLESHNQIYIKQELSYDELEIKNEVETNCEPPLETFACPLYNYSTARKDSLKKHIERTHPNEKPYECRICDSKFARHSWLKKHLKTHKGEKLFECHTCHSKFAKKCRLYKHMQTHSEDKSFECNICDYKSRWKDNLKIHIMTVHTEDTPFKCSECDLKFARITHLQKHMKIHIADKHIENLQSRKTFQM